MVKFHRNILAFFGFVLFCLWERNQEQMLSHMECAGCCVYFTTTVDIFFNERRRKNWNENVVSSSRFEARFLRDLKRTCPSHTLYAAQFKQSSCYVSDFSSNLFDRCSRFICFREKRDEWNVCWTTKSSIFFGAKYLPLGFDLKIVVKLTENVLFEELPWQPIWYYRKLSRW